MQAVAAVAADNHRALNSRRAFRRRQRVQETRSAQHHLLQQVDATKGDRQRVRRLVLVLFV